MVSWGWIPVSIVVGAFIGAVLMALIAVSREDDKPE